MLHGHRSGPQDRTPGPSAEPSMQPAAAKEVGNKEPRERARKGTQGAGSHEERAKGPPTGEPPKPGWTLTQDGLEAMHPAQCHRHLLFGDLLEDVGAVTSIFPRESVELGYRMPDLWAWTRSESPAARQDRLLGVLKAAEARGRVRALRLRYAHMRVRPGGGRRGQAGSGTAPGPPRRGAKVVPRGGGGPAGRRRQGRKQRPRPRPARRRRRSRSSSCARSPRAPPCAWSCFCRRS